MTAKSDVVDFIASLIGFAFDFRFDETVFVANRQLLIVVRAVGRCL